jgi:hypothetical protein
MAARYLAALDAVAPPEQVGRAIDPLSSAAGSEDRQGVQR